MHYRAFNVFRESHFFIELLCFIPPGLLLVIAKRSQREITDACLISCLYYIVHLNHLDCICFNGLTVFSNIGIADHCHHCLSQVLLDAFYNIIHVQLNDRPRTQENWSFAELVLPIKRSQRETAISADTTIRQHTQAVHKQKYVHIQLNYDYFYVKI